MASSQMKPRNIAPLTTTAFLAFPHSRQGRRRRRPTGAAILVIAQIVFASPDRRSTFEANRRGNTRGRSATGLGELEREERKLVCGIPGRHGRPQKMASMHKIDILQLFNLHPPSPLGGSRSEVSPRVACILLHSSSPALARCIGRSRIVLVNDARKRRRTMQSLHDNVEDLLLSFSNIECSWSVQASARGRCSSPPFH